MSPLIRVMAGAAGVTAAALGAASLAAWRLGGWRMARLGPDGIPIGPVTAFLFVMLGLAIAALMRWPDARAARGAGLAISAGAFVLSSLAAAQWWSYFALPWDRWLLGSETLVGAMPLGRMSPLTVITFLFTSVSFMAQLAAFRERRTLRWAALIAGGLGFVISAEVVAAFAAGVPRPYGGQITPMAVLTALAFAALNLGLLLRAGGDSLHAWLKPDIPGEDRRFYRLEIAAMVVMASLTAFASLFYLREEQASARVEAYQQLDAIANLKAAQIGAWRDERMGEARLLLRTKAVAQDVAALIARPGGLDERAQLIDWLEPIRGGTRYESTLLYDANGRLLLAIPDSPAPLTSAASQLLGRALASRDVLFSDLHHDGESSAIRLDILVPIRPRPATVNETEPAVSRPPIAVIVRRLDPDRILFPLVQTWPVPSQTAETLLVRREGNEVVYLSKLRHQPNAPLTLRRSMDDPFLPATMGLRGRVDAREGLDYRGTAVLATSRPIPGSAWVLMVKIDQSEAYAPVRRRAWQAGALVGLLMLALILGGGFFSRQRRSEFLRRALRAEQERALVSERLALVTRYANDIMLLTEEDGRVLEANDRALAVYGYTLDEIRALPPGGLRPPETAADLSRQLALVESQGGAIVETLHRRRDGSVFFVEMSVRFVAVGERRLFLFITRDISQRKEQDAEIARLNRLYAAHSQVNQAIVHADTRDALLHGVCRGLVEAGRFPMAWIGQPDPTSGLIEPIAHFGDASGYLRDIQITLDEAPEGQGPAGIAIRENRTVVCNDFLNDHKTKPWHEAARRAGFRASIALPVRLGVATRGALMAYAAEAGFFGAHEVALIEEAALDVGFGLESLEREAQRAKAEEALSRSEERLRLTLAAGHQGLYDLNVETGEAMVSPEYVTMLGHDPASFHETVAAWIERLHPEDREQASRAFADYIAGRRPDYRIEFRLRTRTGDWKWILSMGQIVERTRDGQPVRMLGTHTDITDLKRAEAAVAASEVRYRRLFESAKDGILILDALTGMVVDVNPFLIELLGFSREAFLDKAIWDLGFFRDIVANQDGFAELQNQEYIRYEDKPLETADGRRIDVEFISNVYLVGDRKVIQCNVRDITARRRAEVALRASLHEKEALLKEVHHRVKNNLQVITSLLRLEASRAAEPSTKMVLKDMQGRIRSMALLHETLYRTGNFARIDLAGYLRQLATQLFRMQNTEASRVHLAMDLENVRVDIDQAIPCGLIVNELMTNCLKHAFADGGSGDVRLGLLREADGAVRLSVSDTGPGLPTDFEARRGRSLGLQLVSDLARQIAGTLRIEPGPGAAFTVVFAPRDSPVERGGSVNNPDERAPSPIVDEKGDSRSLLAAMVEGSYDAIIATTTEGTITHWNPAATSLFGYTADEAIGRSVTMLAPPGESEVEVGARIRRAIAGENLKNEETVSVRKDGSRFDCRLSLSCIRNGEGVPMGFLALLQDITERKGAEEALRASEERYRSILNASPDAVAITDLAGRVLIVTPMTLRMLGGKQNEDVLGRPILDFVAPEDRGRASSNLALRLQEARTDPAEYRGMRLDGGTFDIEVNAAFIRDADGRPSEMVMTVRDITTRKQAEEALASSLREKEGLLKETHHRVKNNLALITSLMRITAGRSSDPETRTVLKEMQDRIHSVLLLNETLYKTASYTQVKLADYLRQISSHVFRAQNAHTGDVRLVLDLEPVDVATAQAIPCGLIVNELLTNSLKHAFPAGRGGEVRVGLHRGASGVQIRVSDNGVGLPANFEAARSESLGLQLISDLSKQLLGNLSVGPASTFTVTFPAPQPETGTLPPPTGP